LPPTTALSDEPSPISLLPPTTASSLDEPTAPSLSIQLQNGWPDWTKQGWAFLMMRDRGEDWKRLAMDWAELELKYQTLGASSGPSTAGRSSGLPTAGRPQAVAWWLGRGRKHPEDEVPVGDINAYSSAWWSWWGVINPRWWGKDQNRQLIAGGHGDWDCLRVPGPNSIFIVLMCLVWWFAKVDAPARTTWLKAVQDVAWVVSKLRDIHSPLPVKAVTG
jgi:hypothetical protein